MIPSTSHVTKTMTSSETHGAGGVFSPDEEVEEEAHSEDGGRVESGCQERRPLPVSSLQSLVESGRVVACRRAGGGYSRTTLRGVLMRCPDWRAHPMNMKRTMAAVMRAPRLAGDNIPNMANTTGM